MGHHGNPRHSHNHSGRHNSASAFGSKRKVDADENLVPIVIENTKSNTTTSQERRCGCAKIVKYSVCVGLVISFVCILLYGLVVLGVPAVEPLQEYLFTSSNVSNATEMESQPMTPNPTMQPTFRPSLMPISPTLAPVPIPTSAPSMYPSQAPTGPTLQPTKFPTLDGETRLPTETPTSAPSMYSQATNSPSFAPTQAQPTVAPTLGPDNFETILDVYEIKQLGSNDLHFPALNYVSKELLNVPYQTYQPSRTGYSTYDWSNPNISLSVDPRLDSEDEVNAFNSVCDSAEKLVEFGEQCIFTQENQETQIEVQTHPLLNDYAAPIVPELLAPILEIEHVDFVNARSDFSLSKPKTWAGPSDSLIFSNLQTTSAKFPYFMQEDRASRQVERLQTSRRLGVVPVAIVSTQYTDYRNFHEHLEDTLKSYWEYLSRGKIRLVGIDGSNYPTNINVELPFTRAQYRTQVYYYIPYIWWRAGIAGLPDADIAVDNPNQNNYYYQRWLSTSIYNKISWAGGLVATMNTKTKTATMLYATGTLWGLGKSYLLERNATTNEFYPNVYADSLTFMASDNSELISAAHYHSIGLAEIDEVIYVRPGYSYRLRAVQCPELLYQVALVHIEPFTGNRIWFSYYYDNGNRKLLVHVTSSGNSGPRRLFETLRTDTYDLPAEGEKHVDESGLVFTFTQIRSRFIEVSVSFDPEQAQRLLEPKVLINQVRVSGTTRLINITITNPNSNSLRPYVLLDSMCSSCTDRAVLFMNDRYEPDSGPDEPLALTGAQNATYSFTVTRTKSQATKQIAAFRVWQAFETRFYIDFSQS